MDPGSFYLGPTVAENASPENEMVMDKRVKRASKATRDRDRACTGLSRSWRSWRYGYYQRFGAVAADPAIVPSSRFAGGQGRDALIRKPIVASTERASSKDPLCVVVSPEKESRECWVECKTRTLF